MAEENLEGGCLCGAVRYRCTGETLRFYHCHCGRCRRASGTGHATNLILKPGQIQWIKGEEQLGRYKVPEAERFATCFCRHCGSPLPREVKELAMLVVPAGSLDSVPELQPQARIFWDSRAEWSCAAGGLPVFAEYPPAAG